MPLLEEPLATANPAIANLARHSRSLGDYAKHVVKNEWMSAEEVAENTRLMTWILERANLSTTMAARFFSPNQLDDAIEKLLSPEFSEPEDVLPPQPSIAATLEATFESMREYDSNIIGLLRAVLTDDEDVTEEKICIAWERMMKIITAYNNGIATQTQIGIQKIRTALSAYMLNFTGSWDDLKRTLDDFEIKKFGRAKTDYEEGTKMDLEIFEGREEEYVTVHCTDRLVKIYCGMDYIKVYVVHERYAISYPTYG